MDGMLPRSQARKGRVWVELLGMAMMALVDSILGVGWAWRVMDVRTPKVDPPPWARSVDVPQVHGNKGRRGK
jgi:hypothetical protein